MLFHENVSENFKKQKEFKKKTSPNLQITLYIRSMVNIPDGLLYADRKKQ